MVPCFLLCIHHYRCFVSAPPSYAECVFGKVDIHDDEDNQYTRGDMAYAPVYTYYNWENPNGNPAVAPNTQMPTIQ